MYDDCIFFSRHFNLYLPNSYLQFYVINLNIHACIKFTDVAHNKDLCYAEELLSSLFAYISNQLFNTVAEITIVIFDNLWYRKYV